MLKNFQEWIEQEALQMEGDWQSRDLLDTLDLDHRSYGTSVVLILHDMVDTGRLNRSVGGLYQNPTVEKLFS